MSTGDRSQIESAVTFLRQARIENLTAMHATRGIRPEAYAANQNAASLMDTALRHLQTYLGGWHAMDKPPQRERESA
jgi:hypothetical protein